MRVLFSDYGIFDDQRRIGPIQWPHFDLLFIHQGSVELSVNNDTFTLSQDQAIIIFPYTDFAGHSLTKSSKGSVHHFQLNNAELHQNGFQHLSDKFHKQRGFILLDTRGKETLRQYICSSLELELKVEETILEAAQNHLLSLFLLFSYADNIYVDEVISYHSPEQKIADFLTKDLASNYSLEEIANLVHLSPSHVRRLFKKRFNMGPNKYHTQLKVAEACKLLRESNEPIKSIYQSLGFSDLSNFYRVFRLHTGKPPACYRKESQQPNVASSIKA